MLKKPKLPGMGAINAREAGILQKMTPKPQKQMPMLPKIPRRPRMPVKPIPPKPMPGGMKRRPAGPARKRLA